MHFVFRCLVVCVALAGRVQAQPPAAAPPLQPASLAQAFDLAWMRHPQAAAATAREEEAQARIELANGLTPGPAALSLSNLNDRANRDRGRQEWEAEMAVPLWLPGQQDARVAEADSLRAQVAANARALRLQLAGEVREAWWALAAARNSHELALRRADTARALESGVRRRYRAGDLSRIDANLAQGERLTAEADALEAEAALRTAEQAWQKLTGVSAPAQLVEEAPLPTAPPDAALTDDHPLLALAAASARAAHSTLRVAEQTQRDAPELAVRLVRERSDSATSYANGIGVKLTIPFSSGARVRQENAVARAEALQAQADLAQIRHRIELDLARARREVDMAGQQLAMARERRALAADSLQLAEKSFALGESDLASLLRLRGSAYEAETFFNRQRVALAAAHSRLKQALGVLP